MTDCAFYLKNCVFLRQNNENTRQQSSRRPKQTFQPSSDSAIMQKLPIGRPLRLHLEYVSKAFCEAIRLPVSLYLCQPSGRNTKRLSLNLNYGIGWFWNQTGMSLLSTYPLCIHKVKISVSSPTAIWYSLWHPRESDDPTSYAMKLRLPSRESGNSGFDFSFFGTEVSPTV